MVGLAVLRRVAPIIVATAPSLATAASGSSGSSSHAERVGELVEEGRRIVAVIRTGNVWRPIRATASASAVTALSSLSIEPCPARPAAVSRIQAMPFSAVSIR